MCNVYTAPSATGGICSTSSWKISSMRDREDIYEPSPITNKFTEVIIVIIVFIMCQKAYMAACRIIISLPILSTYFQ
jgi:hypothetical protein